VRSTSIVGGDPRHHREWLAEAAPRWFAAGVLPVLEPSAPPIEPDLVELVRTPTVSRILGEARRGPLRAVRVRMSAADEVVVMKESWDPGWRATVDGVEVPTIRFAPCFVGVRVPLGEHLVELEHHGPPEREPLLMMAGVVLVGMWMASRRLR
jgi:hypothetical protein